MEVMLTLLGIIWLSQEFATWNVSHTQLEMVPHHYVNQHVPMMLHSQDIERKILTVSTHHKVNKLCSLMDQLKHASMFMPIS